MYASPSGPFRIRRFRTTLERERLVALFVVDFDSGLALDAVLRSDRHGAFVVPGPLRDRQGRSVKRTVPRAVLADIAATVLAEHMTELLAARPALSVVKSLYPAVTETLPMLFDANGRTFGTTDHPDAVTRKKATRSIVRAKAPPPKPNPKPRPASSGLPKPVPIRASMSSAAFAPLDPEGAWHPAYRRQRLLSGLAAKL